MPVSELSIQAPGSEVLHNNSAPHQLLYPSTHNTGHQGHRRE